MSAYSKGTWFLIGVVIVAMLSLIDVIEVRIPAGVLSTDLMLGVTLLGFASIFVWLNHQREPAKPQKQINSFHFVGRVNDMTVYEAYSGEESADVSLETPKAAPVKRRILRHQTASTQRG
ncbi:MAG: hypothetical protein NT075_03250 [Chloroflexi bacterium]|nr:hypothetical protein [Chloroflexota bacterium]